MSAAFVPAERNLFFEDKRDQALAALDEEWRRLSLSVVAWETHTGTGFAGGRGAGLTCWLERDDGMYRARVTWELFDSSLEQSYEQREVRTSPWSKGRELAVRKVDEFLQEMLGE